MATTQDTVTLNRWGGLSVSQRTRTSSRSTNRRWSLEIKADAVTAALDATKLGRPVAEAIAEAIREGIRAITATVADTTLEKRKYAAAAFARGARWAMKRYAGGQIGSTPPEDPPSRRLFNDSGRLAKSIVARATKEGEWVINVAANRLNQPDQVVAWMERLLQLVPVLADPHKLATLPPVRAAIEKVLAELREQFEASRDRFLAGTERLLGAIKETAETAHDVATAAEE